MDVTLEVMAHATCRQWLGAFVAHTPATRQGEDAEALHEMRVAARRLEAAIRLFGDYLPPWAVESRPTLRNVMQALGAARDFDVQIEFIRERSEHLSADEVKLLGPLEARLASGRAQAHAQLIEVLDSAETRQWLARWVEFTSNAPELRPEVTTAAHPAAFALAALRRNYKRVRKAVDRLGSESTAEDYHEVRSRVKRLRYAIEAFAPLCEESAAKYLRELVRVQTVLGEYQDAEVRATHLATLAQRRSHPLPGATLLLMGRIVERDARKGRKARRRFPKVYRCMRGRPWKRLRRSLVAAEDVAAPILSHSVESSVGSRNETRAGA
jgi:CHAD domain-containing protein